MQIVLLYWDQQLLRKSKTVNNIQMRDSFENSPSRYSNRNNNSLDSKRGIFTSKLFDKEEKPNAHPYLDNSLDPNSLNGSKHQVFYKTREYLIPPPPPQGQRTSYYMGNVDSNRQTASRITPPPEVRFQYQGDSRGQSPIKYIPIQNTHHSYINNGVRVEEPIQVRKTYVPHHIYNHIPVNMSASVSSQHPNTAVNAPTSIHTDEAYQLLLKEYEKLYKKLEKESEQNRELEQALRNKTEHSQHLPSQAEHVNKKYSLNVQVLHDRLYGMYEEYVNKVIKKRKQGCHRRMQELFANASKQISITTTSVIEEQSY